MSYKCEVIDRPAQPMLAVHTRAAVQNLPQVLGQSYGTVMQYLGQTGQQPVGAPFVAYLNEDIQNLDLEIGFPTATSLPGNESVKAGTIPAGKAVSCLYVGPYSGIAPAYEAVMSWIKEKGYQGTGTCYEFYLNDPAQTAPEALQTQIVMPLK